jgi:DNA (cytosine-5)-methyltransferase 1
MAKGRLRLASFFSGIGGFDLGFERAGYEVVFISEKEPFCLSVLRKNWPKATINTDILNLHEKIPTAEVWTAGFPCQDVSLARARPRAGLEGKRTGLFFPFIELVKEHLPNFVVLENVPGLLNSNRGRDFALVLRKMAELGYSVGWRVLNSKYFGVPQSRQRVYVVASRRNREDPFKILFEPERGDGHLEAREKSKKEPFSPFRNCSAKTLPRSKSLGEISAPDLAFCLAATSGRHTGTDWSRTYISYKKDVRRLTPLECERIQGFPDDWTNLLDKNEDDSPRYFALGNAVSVPCAQWIANRILKVIES